MKKAFTVIFLLAILIIASGKMYAGVSDTLVVYANKSTLDEVIVSDTLANGKQAHSVYKLVSLDTTYIYLGTISVKSDITVLGVLGADGRPPCIQPAVKGDGSIPIDLFTLNGIGTKGTFKNLYLLGLSTTGTTDWTSAIKLMADNITLTVDNCVFEAWWQYAIGYKANGCKFYISNCKFRNLAQPSWYSGEVLRCMDSNLNTDTIVMKYNTILCGNSDAACPVTKKMIKYFEFSHNSIVWMFKGPLWIFNVTNAKINDNIFYGVHAGGISKTEYPWWDQLWSEEYNSLIDLDTLDLAKDSVFAPEYIGNSNFRWLAEAKRNVEVKNNVYFTPSRMTDFVTSWNDTATVDYVYSVKWMNDRTAGIFADKTHWPGIVESGNQNVDPGFGSTIMDILDADKGNGIGLLNYFREIRTGVASTNYWGYKLTVVEPKEDWTPAWPLPEAADLKYSNAALKTAGTDGLPVGDPSWFTGYIGTKEEPNVTAPKEFSLAQNYPNPFNPSTVINYTIPQSSFVTLKVFNALGQEVAALVNSEVKAGNNSVTFNASKLSSGIYFYTIKAGNFTSSKKMILMK
jgi:hypothetical protein